MKSCINGGTPEVKMHFCFKEKENGGECLEIAVKPETTDDGWIIRPPLYPCTVVVSTTLSFCVFMYNIFM